MDCPRTFGLRVLARKWSYFTLRALRKPLTFSELCRELHFATNHIVSRELKQLQSEQLIGQSEGKYVLTDAGAALLVAVEPLYNWGRQHKGMRQCSPEQLCSKCVEYPALVGGQLYQVK
jgi:DNA-binding HxlR family transcriptional regulator